MEQNKVNVKIYGQDFTISGDQPRDHIIKVADFVDRKMHELAQVLPPCPVSSLAVLTAVNSADDYYSLIRELESQKARCVQMEKDAQHYVQLWEEAKRNFLQYKEDAQSALEQKEDLLRRIREQEQTVKELSEKIKELEDQNGGLKRRNENLVNRMEDQENEKESSSSMVKELEAKCRDMETIYFDLQMENIQLKAELDRYKKIVE